MSVEMLQYKYGTTPEQVIRDRHRDLDSADIAPEIEWMFWIYPDALITVMRGLLTESRADRSEIDKLTPAGILRCDVLFALGIEEG